MTHGRLPTVPPFLDGVIATVNAVEDCVLIINAPSCADLRPSQLAQYEHDLCSTLYRYDAPQRVLSTGVGTLDLTMGTEGKVERAMRLVAEVRGRRPLSLVLIAEMSPVFLTNIDYECFVADLGQELGLRAAVVSKRGFADDYLDGFAATLEAIAVSLPLEDAAPQPGRVAVVGYMQDRNEMDHRANVDELQRMLGALGLEAAPVLLDGNSFAQMRSMSAAESLISLPYAASACERLSDRLGRQHVEMPLPVGIQTTTSWVLEIGRQLCRLPEAETFVERELATLVPRLQWAVRDIFMSRAVAVAADPHLAAGLVPFLHELGFAVRHVALRTRSVAHARRLREQWTPLGIEAPIVHDTSFPQLCDTWRQLAAEGLDLIVGSSSERDAAKPLRVPFLELGYPSRIRHSLFDSPWVGFRGAAWLADRLCNLLTEARFTSA